MSRILVVDDDHAHARALQLHIDALGHATATAYDADSCLRMARAAQPDLVLLDIRMPGRSGLEVLPEIKGIDGSPAVLMMTAYHDMDTTIGAMQAGAEDYLHKPIDLDQLDDALARMLRRDPLGERIEVDQTAQRPCLVGGSRIMAELYKRIALLARSEANVLVTGETGTGKELVARAIHEAGGRADGPFVAVNCAAVVETLLESDLFGHEKGAFSGAVGRHPGKFAVAEHGTIFLDEVGEMSPAMQAKLLRVLQYKEFTPLGAARPRQVDTRIVAATNVDLAERVAAGTFREDLYYRLEVCTVHVPALRERLEDLPELARALLARINAGARTRVTHITRPALERLAGHDWPGNVRELENLLIKAAALSPRNVITADGLALEGGAGPLPRDAASAEGGLRLPTLRELERQHVQRVLEITGWHRGEACRILGITRPTLRRMIREHSLLEHPAGGSDTDA